MSGQHSANIKQPGQSASVITEGRNDGWVGGWGGLWVSIRSLNVNTWMEVSEGRQRIKVLEAGLDNMNTAAG